MKYVSAIVVLGLSLLGCAEAGAQAAKADRKPAAALASLPQLRAGGALRVLLVDDNASPNNIPGSANRNEGSDAVYSELVAAAVGGDAKAWSLEVAQYRKDGPTLDRLRDYNVVIWYTGDSYGSGADTLSKQDEDTARQYLQQTGGAFVLISPGYVNNLLYGATWQSSAYPFLNEVMGIDGVAPLAQRFASGRVTAASGAEFSVVHPGVAETQFSAVNSNGAAVVFSSTLDPARTAAGPVPVAVANPYGGGRFVYVGFTFENIPAADRAKAFGALLAAATGRAAAKTPVLRTTAVSPVPAAPAGTAATPTPVAPVAAASAGAQRNQTLRVAPPGPDATQNLRVTGESAGLHHIGWETEPNDAIKSFDIYRRDADGWRFVRSLERYVGGRNYGHDDRAFVALNSAYKVVSVYADGREGEAVVEYPNPPQPQLPTDFKVVQIGQGEIRIEWVEVQPLGRYRLFGPGFPGDGKPNGWTRRPDGRTALTVKGFASGTYAFRIAADYGGGGPALLASPQPTASVTVVDTDRSTYRVLFLGLQMGNPVNDDILDGDGKGNEVFAAALIATTAKDPVSNATIATRVGVAETRVYGDNGNFPDRIRAGSAGPTGGLRTGDLVPGLDASVPHPGEAGFNDRFPLKVWEGELTDTGKPIAVLPIVIEWNSTDHSTLSLWLNFWGPGGTIPQQLGAQINAGSFTALSKQPLVMYGTWKINDTSKRYDDPTVEQRPNIPYHTPAADRDHPIGLMFGKEPKAFEVPVYGHDTRGFVFARRLIEAAIPAASSIVVLRQRWEDVTGGTMAAYFQVERLTPLPVLAPKD